MRRFPATPFWPRRSLVLSPPLRQGGNGVRLVKVQRKNDRGEFETWWLLTD